MKKRKYNQRMDMIIKNMAKGGLTDMPPSVILSVSTVRLTVDENVF